MFDEEFVCVLVRMGDGFLGERSDRLARPLVRGLFCLLER